MDSTRHADGGCCSNISGSRSMRIFVAARAMSAKAWLSNRSRMAELFASLITLYTRSGFSTRMITTDFVGLISARMSSEHENLAARWFERLVDLLPVDA